jgi:hypothetical protein
MFSSADGEITIIRFPRIRKSENILFRRLSLKEKPIILHPSAVSVNRFNSSLIVLYGSISAPSFGERVGYTRRFSTQLESDDLLSSLVASIPYDLCLFQISFAYFAVGIVPLPPKRKP